MDRFQEIEAKIRKFNTDRNWTQFHDPKNLAISLQLEASEVLEMFQWTKDNKEKVGKKVELAEELADVYYWLIMLAHHYDIDLLKALEEKMLKNEEKYPISKSFGNSAKYTEL